MLKNERGASLESGKSNAPTASAASSGSLESGAPRSPYPVARVVLFAVVVAAWIAIDQLTKSFFAGQQPGGVLAGPFLGLLDIRLVHNTGGAWGIFSESTAALGIFSIIVCAVIALYFLVSARDCNIVQTLAFALIVAGGIGNAIDRFAQGFVTDFLEFSFMDFPVFNVADIGVTCGFALLIIGMIVSWRNEPASGQGDGGGGSR